MRPERPSIENPQGNLESKTEKKTTAFGKAAELVMRLFAGKFEVKGVENIPEGGSLIVANHSSHIDGWAMAAAFKDHDFRVVVKDVPTDKPKRFEALKKLLPQIGVREVTSHLDPEDREQLKDTDTILGQVITRESNPDDRREDIKYNITALKTIAQNLAEGKKVIYFPEGGFYEEGDTHLRPATEGATAIARLYKKATGKDLNILPAGIEGGQSVIGSNPGGFSAKEIITAIKDKPGEVTIHVGNAFQLQEGESFNDKFQESVGSLLPEEYVRSDAN